MRNIEPQKMRIIKSVVALMLTLSLIVTDSVPVNAAYSKENGYWDIFTWEKITQRFDNYPGLVQDGDRKDGVGLNQIMLVYEDNGVWYTTFNGEHYKKSDTNRRQVNMATSSDKNNRVTHAKVRTTGWECRPISEFGWIDPTADKFYAPVDNDNPLYGHFIGSTGVYIWFQYKAEGNRWLCWNNHSTARDGFGVQDDEEHPYYVDGNGFKQDRWDQMKPYSHQSYDFWDGNNNPAYLRYDGEMMYANKINDDKNFSFAMFMLTKTDRYTVLFDTVVHTGVLNSIKDGVVLMEDCVLTVEKGATLYVEGNFFCNGKIKNYGTIILGPSARMGPHLTWVYRKNADDSITRGYVENHGGTFIVQEGAYYSSSEDIECFIADQYSTVINYGKMLVGCGLQLGDATFVNNGEVYVGFYGDHTSGELNPDNIKMSPYGDLQYRNNISTIDSEYVQISINKDGLNNGGSKIINNGAVGFPNSTIANRCRSRFVTNVTSPSRNDLDNTYMINISTGLTGGASYYTDINGKRAGSNGVATIGVVYKDTSGRSHSEYLFPTKGGYYKAGENFYSESFKLANEYYESDGKLAQESKKLKMMSDMFHVNHYRSSVVGLLSNSVDDYLFRPLYPLQEIEDIVVIMNNDTNWSCDGINIYKADEVLGTDYVGYISRNEFINYSGTLVASWKPTEAGMFNTTGKAMPPKAVSAAKNDASGFKTYNNGSGARVEAAKPYGVCIDLAYTAGAGIQGYTQKANAKEQLENTGMNGNKSIASYDESLVLHMKYTDTNGVVREFYNPVMYSTIMNMLDSGHGKDYIYGLGQAGDTLVFPMMLPGWDGKTKPVTAELYYGSDFEGNDMLRSWDTAQKKVSEDDTIAVTGMQIYKNVPGITVSDNMQLEVNSKRNNSEAESPLWFYTADTSDGVVLANVKKTGQKLDMTNRLQAFYPQAVLSPKNAGGYYVGEITLDTIKNSETFLPVTISFGYTNTKGKIKTTEEINLQDAVEAYYGMWVTEANTWESQNGAGGAYSLKAVPGGKLKFLFNASDVRNFNHATIKITGKSDKDFEEFMQISGISIYGAKKTQSNAAGIGGLVYSYSNNNTVSANGYSSNWTIERDQDISIQYVGYSGTELLPSYQETMIIFNVDPEDAVVVNDVDWDQFSSDYISYADTQQDMGYTKQREEYTVVVKVAKDDNLADNDAGSKNQFYFQLVYDNGKKTGYVLANQQLMSDAFRSGFEETFKICSNYPYGEIAAINIIPDSQQDDNDIFDKLCIETIKVSKEEGAGLMKTWTFDINDWIGIDYFDSGAKNGLFGQLGRSAAELERSFAVTHKGYDVKLLAKMETGDYSKGGTVKEGDPDKSIEFGGTMSYKCSYINSEDQASASSGDVFREMYAYAGLKTSSTSSQGQVSIASTNNSFMKANSSNYFYLQLDAPKTLQKLEFTAKGDQQATYFWHLGKVSIYTIKGGTGRVERTEQGYARQYDLIPMTESIGDSEQYVEVGANGTAQTLSVSFNVNDPSNCLEVDLNSDSKINVVGKEPKSVNDKLRFTVHMDTETEEMGLNTDQYSMWIEGKYEYDLPTGAGEKNYRVDMMQYDRDSGLFYSKVDASGISKLSPISIGVQQLNKLERFTNPQGTYSDYMLIHQIRDSVVVNTMYVDLHMPGGYACDLSEGSSMLKNTFSSMNIAKSGLSEEQTVIISVGEAGSNTPLSRDDEKGIYNDIGVALVYTLEGSGEKVYSPNMFLSELTGGKPVKAHEQYAFTFNQYGIKDIVGIRIFSQGNVKNVKLDGAAILTTSVDKSGNETTQSRTANLYCDEVGDNLYTVADRMFDMPMYTENNIGFATITMKTAENAEGVDDSGLSDKLWAEFSWRTQSGGSRSITVENLKDAIVSGSFNAGDTAVAKFALFDFDSIHLIKFNPYDDTSVRMNWAPETIDIDITTSDFRNVNKKRKINEVIREAPITKTVVETFPEEVVKYVVTDPYTINITDMSFEAQAVYQYASMAKLNASYETDPSGISAEKLYQRFSVAQLFEDDAETDRTFTISANKTLSLYTSSGSSDKNTVDAVKFIKGSFRDILEPTLVEVTESGAENDVTETSGMLSWKRDPEAGTINEITVKGINNTQESAKYKLILTSEEVSTKKFIIYITVDPNPVVVYQTTHTQEEQELVSEGDDEVTESMVSQDMKQEADSDTQGTTEDTSETVSELTPESGT